MDMEYIRYKVEVEGLDYFILWYADAEDYEDEEAKRLFIEAHDALVRFGNHVGLDDMPPLYAERLTLKKERA